LRYISDFHARMRPERRWAQLSDRTGAKPARLERTHCKLGGICRAAIPSIC
jgi:hypothetical protein